ncbi:hypothetical protein THOM_0191 [Trachipleistophora hominis]|uniref:Uncharacterized protein n=1 Tax=Trachipleistophora hominis TaxID=72359 RepID=L7K0I7_TRAHO|nr:hypothetical protein THOM_0191 [Trachipleistophora hominis]
MVSDPSGPKKSYCFLPLIMRKLKGYVCNDNGNEVEG